MVAAGITTAAEMAAAEAADTMAAADTEGAGKTKGLFPKRRLAMAAAQPRRMRGPSCPTAALAATTRMVSNIMTPAGTTAAHKAVAAAREPDLDAALTGAEGVAGATEPEICIASGTVWG